MIRITDMRGDLQAKNSGRLFKSPLYARSLLTYFKLFDSKCGEICRACIYYHDARIIRGAQTFAKSGQYTLKFDSIHSPKLHFSELNTNSW